MSEHAGAASRQHGGLNPQSGKGIVIFSSGTDYDEKHSEIPLFSPIPTNLTPTASRLPRPLCPSEALGKLSFHLKCFWG